MRLALVSNRLPVVVENDGEGPLTVKSASGGLIAALAPILRKISGLWIGWPGCPPDSATELDTLLRDYGRRSGYDLVPVPLTDDDVTGFYHGFSNQIIWPLFHDLQSKCVFLPEYWQVFQSVNRKFADVVESVTRSGDYVWIQDYHLISLGRELRERGNRMRLGFFLHTPFPPPDIFCKLPWRQEVLDGLAAYDLVGFQTHHDCQNFLHCVRALASKTRVRRTNRLYTLEFGGRRMRIGSFPISVDYEEFATSAATPGVQHELENIRREFQEQQIMLGIDRLDYTKGIPERVRAFGRALERFPELHRKLTLIQVVVPSREGVPQYQEQKTEIEQLVSQINGQYTLPGWVPIYFYFRSLERDELLAYYRAADIAFVTPLKDGMNLVCKEYCAAHIDDDGVLILSEFAGAAAELKSAALLVNPYDADGMADTIRMATNMPHGERRRRMRRLRRHIRQHDIFAWAKSFLDASGVPSEEALHVALPPPSPPRRAPAAPVFH